MYANDSLQKSKVLILHSELGRSIINSGLVNIKAERVTLSLSRFLQIRDIL